MAGLGVTARPDSGDVKPDLSVVVPAYNESGRIERALAEVTRFLEGRGRNWEVIVIDDGSSDQTALMVQRFHAGDRRVQLVRHGKNRGKGAAVRTGVAATRGAKVLVMDADLATPISELDVVERVLAEGAQVVAGSRAAPGANVTRAQSPLRVLLGRAGNLWIRALAVPGIQDTQCGFKLFDGDVARKLFALCREDRFGIDIEALCIARRHLRVRVAEVGVRWEHQDGSKVRWKDYVDVLVKVPQIVWSVMRLPPPS